MSVTSRCVRWAPILSLAPLLGACAQGPCYFRRVGEVGERQPAESLSFEARDYGDLARLFADELEEHPIYTELRGGGAAEKPPAIAHREFRVDMSDRNTKASLMEQKIRVELQRAGVRYINEQERSRMIEAIKEQHSDLNDTEARARFGHFANAGYYLVGRMYEVMHMVSLDQRKREFHLVVELLDVETLESRFVTDVVVTKYMEKCGF